MDTNCEFYEATYINYVIKINFRIHKIKSLDM